MGYKGQKTEDGVPKTGNRGQIGENGMRNAEFGIWETEDFSHSKWLIEAKGRKKQRNSKKL